MPLTEHFTVRSGVRIRYLDNRGDESAGLPILLVPGFTDFADEYAEVLEYFLPRRTVVVEVRGRGGSEAPPAGYRAADHADDLEAVLAEAEIGRFHLMTFSRGTTFGLDLTLRDPTRVATISIGDYRARELAIPLDAVDSVMVTRFRGTPMSERIPPHVVTELFRASRDRDLHDDVAATAIPVLVATGTEPGCMLDADAIQEYRHRIPGAEIVTIDGAAHDLFRPIRLAYPQAVADFVQRRTP
jgi:pimeloyl-ACP methyl ester carboxylesterase